MTLQNLSDENLLLLYANDILRRNDALHHSENFNWDVYNRICDECDAVHDEIMRRLSK